MEFNSIIVGCKGEFVTVNYGRAVLRTRDLPPRMLFAGMTIDLFLGIEYNKTRMGKNGFSHTFL